MISIHERGYKAINIRVWIQIIHSTPYYSHANKQQNRPIKILFLSYKYLLKIFYGFT